MFHAALKYNLNLFGRIMCQYIVFKCIYDMFVSLEHSICNELYLL